MQKISRSCAERAIFIKFQASTCQSGVAPANQTKERPVHELFPGAFRNKSSICESCLCFPKEKHQNSQKWAKFVNFSFWPFFWFGLLGRLLRQASEPPKIDRGCKSSFGLRAPKASRTGAKESCTSAKQGFGGVDSWETFAPWVQTTFCALS